MFGGKPQAYDPKLVAQCRVDPPSLSLSLSLFPVANLPVLKVGLMEPSFPSFSEP